MTTLYDATKRIVHDQLAKISTSAGYHTDPSVLEGFLTFYVEDIVNGVDGLHFPTLCVQYAVDNNSQQKNTTVNKCSRSLIVNGAVSTGNRHKINEALDDLVFDVKVALCSLAGEVTIDKIVYSLPEDNSAYAMFTAELSINHVEHWKHND